MAHMDKNHVHVTTNSFVIKYLSGISHHHMVTWQIISLSFSPSYAEGKILRRDMCEWDHVLT